MAELTHDTLRAELALQRLSIREDIEHAVKPISDRIVALDQGTFTEAQTNVIRGVTEDVITGRVDGAWTHRARLITVASVLLASGSLLCTGAIAAITIFG